MGTSSSRSAPTGGPWTGAKGNATRFAKGGASVQSAMSSYVRALRRSSGSGSGGGGGSGGAGGGRGSTGQVFRHTVSSAQNLAGFFATAATEGFEKALRDFGLEELIGKSPIEVIAGLLEALSGPGMLLDESVAQAAMVEVLGDLYEDAGDTYDELAKQLGQAVDPTSLSTILEDYLVEAIYQKTLSDLAERISENCDTAQLTANKEMEIRDYIEAMVSFDLEGRNPLQIDWKGQEGRRMIERNIGAALDQIEIGDGDNE